METKVDHSIAVSNSYIKKAKFEQKRLYQKLIFSLYIVIDEQVTTFIHFYF